MSFQGYIKNLLNMEGLVCKGTKFQSKTCSLGEKLYGLVAPTFHAPTRTREQNLDTYQNMMYEQRPSHKSALLMWTWHTCKSNNISSSCNFDIFPAVCMHLQKPTNSLLPILVRVHNITTSGESPRVHPHKCE